LDVIKRESTLLWRERKKSPTMRRRLILFFVLTVFSIILAFTLLLMAFGITGSGRREVHRYMESELSHISQAVSADFGNLSVTGISLAQTLSEQNDRFFEENRISAAQLADHPEYLEPLLSEQMPALQAVSDNNSCGGVFVVLDATVNPNAEHAAERKAGLFIKKTQPASSASIATKEYWLRGPAAVARRYGIELLGQWVMEYELSEIEFFSRVMETARGNPDMAVSRLYFWTDRLCLNDNSEEGMLLCLPLRSADGVVYGVCGIEVSDRMFKQLYSPNESTYQGVFSIVAPMDGSTLYASRGLLAGNSYLTGNQIESDLLAAGDERGFPCFEGGNVSCGGLYEPIRLYPEGSAYADESWSVSVMMPKTALSQAARGSSVYLYFIVGGLLAASVVASILVSRRYLHPSQQGLSTILEGAYRTGETSVGVLEIDSLFEELARDSREHRKELSRLESEMQDAQDEYARELSRLEGEMQRAQDEYRKELSRVEDEKQGAQDEHRKELSLLERKIQGLQDEYEQLKMQTSRLAYSRKQEVDPEAYQQYLDNLHRLTQTERQVFDYYIAGMRTKEVMAAMGFKENTLRFHNKNIYAKLGVSSLKELLRYADIAKQD